MNKINSILQVLKQIVISPKHLFEVSKQIFNILSVLLSLFSDGLQQVIDGLGMLWSLPYCRFSGRLLTNTCQ